MLREIEVSLGDGGSRATSRDLISSRDGKVASSGKTKNGAFQDTDAQNGSSSSVSKDTPTRTGPSVHIGEDTSPSSGADTRQSFSRKSIARQETGPLPSSGTIPERNHRRRGTIDVSGPTAKTVASIVADKLSAANNHKTLQKLLKKAPNKLLLKVGIVFEESTKQAFAEGGDCAREDSAPMM